MMCDQLRITHLTRLDLPRRAGGAGQDLNLRLYSSHADGNAHPRNVVQTAEALPIELPTQNLPVARRCVGDMPICTAFGPNYVACVPHRHQKGSGASTWCGD